MKAKLGAGLFGLGVALVIFMASPLYERFFGRARLRFPYLHPTLLSITLGNLFGVLRAAL